MLDITIEQCTNRRTEFHELACRRVQDWHDALRHGLKYINPSLWPFVSTRWRTYPGAGETPGIPAMHLELLLEITSDCGKLLDKEVLEFLNTHKQWPFGTGKTAVKRVTIRITGLMETGHERTDHFGAPIPLTLTNPFTAHLDHQAGRYLQDTDPSSGSAR